LRCIQAGLSDILNKTWHWKEKPNTAKSKTRPPKSNIDCGFD